MPSVPLIKKRNAPSNQEERNNSLWLWTVRTEHLHITIHTQGCQTTTHIHIQNNILLSLMLGRTIRVFKKIQLIASLELPISPLRQQTQLHCSPPPFYSVSALFVEVDVCLSSKQGRVVGAKCPNDSKKTWCSSPFLVPCHLLQLTFKGKST